MNKMYIAVTKHKNNLLKQLACDSKLLEKKCKEYNVELGKNFAFDFAWLFVRGLDQ